MTLLHVLSINSIHFTQLKLM